jgi:hypothetical protein
MSLVLTGVPVLKLCFIMFQHRDDIIVTFFGFAVQNFQSVSHQGVYILLTESFGFPTSTVHFVLYLFFALLSCLALREYKKDLEHSFEMNKRGMRKHATEKKKSNNNVRVHRHNRRHEKQIPDVPAVTKFDLFKIELVKIKESMMAKIVGLFVKKTPAAGTPPLATRTPSSTQTTSTKDYPTPATFFDACRNGKKDVVRRLLSMTTDDLIDISTTLEEESGNGAIHLACAGGHLSIVQQLMTKFGKEICFELASKDGRTGLELAAMFGRKNIVQVILGTLKGKQMR